jgi:hypothetical protein
MRKASNTPLPPKWFTGRELWFTKGFVLLPFTRPNWRQVDVAAAPWESVWIRQYVFRLAALAEHVIFGPMAKDRVTFKMKRIAEDDWQIEAHYPGVEIRYIKGLKSKAEVDEWLQGSRRIDWLRSQGYAKWPPASAYETFPKPPSSSSILPRAQ